MISLATKKSSIFLHEINSFMQEYATSSDGQHIS